MREGIADIIRSEFNKKNTLTLSELYEIVSKNPNLNIDPSKIKHRIRSTIYSLQQSNEIARIERNTYKKSK